MVHHEVLSLLSKPDIGFIADNLVFNLLDTVFISLIVVDEVVSNPSVIFCLGLAKSGNTSGPVPRCVEGIWPGWSFLITVDDVLAASSDQIRLYDLGLLSVVVLASKLRAFGQSCTCDDVR